MHKRSDIIPHKICKCPMEENIKKSSQICTGLQKSDFHHAKLICRKNQLFADTKNNNYLNYNKNNKINLEIARKVRNGEKISKPSCNFICNIKFSHLTMKTQRSKTHL